MSAANGNGPEGRKGGDGEAKKDDTLVKVAGAAIAAGIAFSLYKSFFVGKKEEHPFGHAKSEPFHEEISIEKPEELQRFQDGARDKAWRFKGGVKDKSGQFKGGAEDFKEDVEEKASDVKSAIARKGQETKEWLSGAAEKVKGGVEEGTDKAKRGVEEGTDKAKRGAEESTERVKEGVEDGEESAAEKTGEAKKGFLGWFNWGKKEVNEEKDEVAYEAEKAKVEAERAVEEGKEYAEEKGSRLLEKADEGKKDAIKKERGFFAKAGSELQRDKREVTKALYAAEQNVEKGAAAVVNKVTHPLGGKSKSRPFGKEYRILRGDTLWDISRRYGVSIEELKVANSIWDADFIVAGDTLTIPK